MIMKQLKQFMLLLLMAVVMTGCSGYSKSTCESLMEKINAEETLTQDDYATMISQYDAIYKDVVKKTESAKSMSDFIEIMFDNKVEYADKFENVLSNADLNSNNQDKFKELSENVAKRLNAVSEKFAKESDDDTDDIIKSAMQDAFSGVFNEDSDSTSADSNE
jgi:hypothetical protein